MHPFFEQNPYRAVVASDLEKDAELALHLVLFLLATQDRDEGSWRGVHIGATLRNTCHALEAFHLLGWEASAGALEAGTAWLINLPNFFGLASEEEDSIRLYPSRFKTLAWLGEFSDFQLRNDFKQLEEHLNADGMLHGIMAKQLLATMIYLDCLYFLDKLQLSPKVSLEKRERALDHIQHSVALWHYDLQQKTQRSHITSAGDLSYAIDLLFRTSRLSKQDEINSDILTALISSIEHPERTDPITSDTLYCAIQLATHFPDIPQAMAAVRQLIHHLRTKYERLELKKEPFFFHPLMLRVLLSYYGDQLQVEMTRLLLAHEQKSLELRRRSAEQGLKDDFRTLIKSRFEVEISEIQPLTGGLTEAEVFRVHFSLKLSSVSEGQEVLINTYQPNPGSLVIKSGSLDSLQRSIGRYQTLPDALKPYFAKYSGEPQILEAAPAAPCYLIMEDLTYMHTFQDIITRIDQGVLLATQKRELESVCQAICASLFAIYDQAKRDDTAFFGPQLSRLYISNIEKNLIRMCRPDKFPHLKSWLRGFWLGERKYVSIEHYLRKLESHKAKLKVPYLMLIHGDCHSRNIMLDAQLRQVRLIDLDHLDEDGDYIMDLARLIEDISVFGFMGDDAYRFHLHKEQIRFVGDSAEARVIENKIEYPIFTSEAVRLFQQHLLRNLATYAQEINDGFWKERLWLALAANLIFLAAKQTEKRYATVFYVEAVKLLDELVFSLDKDLPLGDIPFPGKHPSGVERPTRSEKPDQPAWYREHSLLADTHDEIMVLDPKISLKLTSSGRVAKYFAPNSRQPFAIIDGKKQPPAVLLACPPQALSDPLEMAQERKTSSALQTILQVSDENPTSAVVKLIQQALELNH